MVLLACLSESLSWRAAYPQEKILNSWPFPIVKQQLQCRPPPNCFIKQEAQPSYFCKSQSFLAATLVDERSAPPPLDPLRCKKPKIKFPNFHHFNPKINTSTYFKTNTMTPFQFQVPVKHPNPNWEPSPLDQLGILHPRNSRVVLQVNCLQDISYHFACLLPWAWTIQGVECTYSTVFEKTISTNSSNPSEIHFWHWHSWHNWRYKFFWLCGSISSASETVAPSTLSMSSSGGFWTETSTM